MDTIRFNKTLKATSNGYRYRGYEIIRRQGRYFGTLETVWFVGDNTFGTSKEAKAFIDRMVVKEYIEYREKITKENKK